MIGSTLNDEQLQALGLSRDLLGEAEFLKWPADIVGHGLRFGGPLPALEELIASRFAGCRFLQGRLPVLEECDVSIESLETERRIVKLLGRNAGAMTVHMLPPAARAAHPHPEDPATLFIDFRATTAAWVILSDGTGYLIAPGERGILVTRTFATPLVVEPFAEIDSDVARWIATDEDPWLRGEVQARLMLSDPWENAVAVGLAARFLGSATPAREGVAALLSGRPDPAAARPRMWARGLSPAQIRTLTLLVHAKVMRLHATIDELGETMACDDSVWQEQLLAVCRERDDLASVELLLAEREVAEPVRDDLESLDSDAVRFVRSVPVDLGLDDAHLTRARRLEPGAWWVAAIDAQGA